VPFDLAASRPGRCHPHRPMANSIDVTYSQLTPYRSRLENLPDEELRFADTSGLRKLDGAVRNIDNESGGFDVTSDGASSPASRRYRSEVVARTGASDSTLSGRFCVDQDSPGSR